MNLAKERNLQMQLGQLHYLPLPVPFFAVLAGLFLVLVIIVQMSAFQFAYMRLGLSQRTALMLLLASLLGSYFNIPVSELGQERVVSGQEIDYFGMKYVVPVVVNWPGTVIAVNVGGAVIPAVTSFYLLARSGLWKQALLVTACVAAISYFLARPVPGLGIALPVFVPAISTAAAALLVSRTNAAPLAYVGGSLGTLIGADFLNLHKVPGLGAPVASIGGAGTFDGVFLTGILAVLLASLGDGSSDRSVDRSART
jgi:uncharacterized membrane protein